MQGSTALNNCVRIVATACQKIFRLKALNQLRSNCTIRCDAKFETKQLERESERRYINKSLQMAAQKNENNQRSARCSG